ncbi:hypothetical protein ACO0LM_10645 [Undibacterium sp. Di26W]|uniref:hypothetical protein n=1 Tax=Undibacterium sp. Di26W TaxID=3413035 RepID=UPI003BF3102C
MITKQQILNAIPDVTEFPHWKPATAPTNWTVRIEDGNVLFNENLNRDYLAALTLIAAAQLRDAGFKVTQPTLSFLLVN